LSHKQYKPDEDTLEEYRRTNTFGSASSPDSPYGARSAKKWELSHSPSKSYVETPQYENVGVPDAYPDPRTPASVLERHFTFDMSTPVRVAPPTPRWPVTPKRTYSGASRETADTEHESFIGQPKSSRDYV
jgi:hypothetical protein